MIACFVCHKGPHEDRGSVSVFRVNAVGQKGIWACEQHIKQTDATIDPEVKAVVDAIHNR